MNAEPFLVLSFRIMAMEGNLLKKKEAIFISGLTIPRILYDGYVETYQRVVLF